MGVHHVSWHAQHAAIFCALACSSSAAHPSDGASIQFAMEQSDPIGGSDMSLLLDNWGVSTAHAIARFSDTSCVHCVP